MVGFSVDLSKQCDWHWFKLFLEPASWAWSVCVAMILGNRFCLAILYFETCVVLRRWLSAINLNEIRD